VAIDLRRLLLDLNQSDEDMVVLALRTLKRLQPKSIANHPTEAQALVLRLEELVEQSSDEVVFFAQECLEFVQLHHVAEPPEAPEAPEVPPLKENQLPPKTSATREQALAFLSRGGGPPQQTAPALLLLRSNLAREEIPLVRKYLQHQAPQVRMSAMLVLNATGDERIILESMIPYLHDRVLEVRETALKCVRGIDKERLLVVIGTMLRSNKINVKVAAVYILAHLQGTEVVHFLGLAARDSNEEVRTRVVDALSGRRGKDVLVILKGLVNDLDIDVAEKALKLYEKLKFEEGILNSSAELGDVIMEKLLEISMEPDEEKVERVEPQLAPTSQEERIKLGGRDVKVTEYVVPKKDAPSAPSADEVKHLAEYTDDVQTHSEKIYDELDDVLEEMGRTIWSLERANRITDKRFAKLNYDIQRYEDMLAKRKDEAARASFWESLSPGNRRIQAKQQLNLEFSLSERYRRLGELAVELSHAEDLEFKEVERYYRKVEGLLNKVRELKKKAGE